MRKQYYCVSGYQFTKLTSGIRNEKQTVMRPDTGQAATAH